jgi:hypothetical protein
VSDDPVTLREITPGNEAAVRASRAAMALVIDVVRNSHGATDFFTSVHPGDGGPAPFYQALGFEATGKWTEGEEVYRLPLHPGT